MKKSKVIFLIFIFVLSDISLLFSAGDFDTAYDLLKKEKYADSLYYYEKALAANPLSQDIWMEYTICLRKLKRLQKAAQAGWRALELGAESHGLWGNLGNVFLDAHAWDRAFETYKNASSLSKDVKWSVQNFLNLGFEQWIFRNYREALKAFDYAYELDKNNALTILDRGILFASSGQVEKGKQEIEKALTLMEKENNKNGIIYAQRSLEQIKNFGKIEPFWADGKSYQILPDALLKRPPKNSALKLQIKTTVKRLFPIEDKILTIETPEDWLEEISNDRDKEYFTITFFQKYSEKRFKMLISPLKVNNELTRIKSIVEKNGNNMLSNSVETSLNLREINGSIVKGYAYILTDKTYKAGDNNLEEFPYLTQGLLKCKDLTLTFTILSLFKEKEYIDSVLKPIENIFYK